MKRRRKAFPPQKERFRSVWQLMSRYPQLGRLFLLWEELSPVRRRELAAIGRALREVQRQQKQKLGERLVGDEGVSHKNEREDKHSI